MFQALDGKKTLIGIVVAQLPQIVDAVAKIIGSTGGDPSDFVKVAGGIISGLGLLHKFLKG